MKENRKKIAIIPARSGSKGLKDKNIINLCGKPMMNYSIEAALEAKCFDRVIVSTDSVEYGEIAKKAGAEVIFRGHAASSDTASTYMVIEDLFNRIGISFDYFTLLQPTSPLRRSHHILEAVEAFEARFMEFDFLVSMKAAEHAKVLVNCIDEDGSLKFFDTDFSEYRRQSYLDYSPNGAIFMGKPRAYLEKKHFFGPRSLAYIMNKIDSVDIDDSVDFELAKICMQRI